MESVCLVNALMVTNTVTPLQVSLNGSNVIGERLSKQDLSLEGTPMVVYKSTDPGG